MQEPPITTAKKAFHCTRCHGRILVPRELPATTAPCPYCGEMVTSPAPVEDLPWPKPEIAAVPAETPQPKPLPAAPAPEAPLEKTPTSPAPAAVSPGQATQVRQWLPVVGFFLLLAIAAAFAVNLALRQDEKPLAPTVETESVTELLIRENHYLRSGWRKDAERVLSGFITARTIREKLPFVIDDGSVEQRMLAFYGDQMIDDTDTPAESFAVRELSMDDRRRGMFLMIYDQPPQIDMREFFKPLAPLEVQYGLEEADLLLSSVARTRNFAMEPLRVNAFFKRTADGLKLDWDVFAQTKYRWFEDFLEAPGANRSGVFRVLIMQDVASPAQSRSGMEVYLMADPAHRSQTARVAVQKDSEIGRILAEINWRGKMDSEPKSRSATLELTWTGEPGGRTLEITRFICWEFLGLGGVANTPAKIPE